MKPSKAKRVGELLGLVTPPSAERTPYCCLCSTEVPADYDPDTIDLMAVCDKCKALAK